MFNFGEFITAGYVYAAASFALSVLLITVKNLIGKERHYYSYVEYMNVNIVAALVLWLLGYPAQEIFILSGLSVTAILTAHKLLRNFTIAGRLLIVSYSLFTIFGVMWGVWFLVNIDVSTTTRILMLTGYPLLFLTLFGGIVTAFEQWEVLGKVRWSRPSAPLPKGGLKHFPKVCIQVPAYSEPPDVVIGTLDSIAKLNYPNFEVMVIDNNTKDPNLWKPVERHCRKLGERFRFFHVDPIEGAKAGALNYAMKYTPEDVEIIGVVDSDYQVRPDFLERLVGYFEDPKIGFVQTPHDYREWEGSLYQRMCYWEYKYFFETVMPSLNERDAALTVGTMSLIRKKALEEAGGWAEWCATEDSELSIRIHAAGYSSVYTSEAFGHGLIPETFSGYKKQRFRWTYGPVQELKRHFSLYLPKFLAKSSLLTRLQKIHHLNHGFGYLNLGLGALFIPFGLAAMASMMYHGESVAVPSVLWTTSLIVVFSSFILRWLVYHVYMKCSLKDTIGAFIANSALSHTYIVASIKCIFTREIEWQRTNKFKSPPLGLGALTSAQTELFIGILILGACLLSFSLHPGTGFQFMLGLAMVMKSMDYLAAPALALLAERDLRKAQEAERFVSEPVHGNRSPYHTMKRSMNSPDNDRSAGRPY
jgi:cellulose synthase/poly-beta-1,6-N-acetylglucosamine synthase-like glycosyltransferase